MTVRRLVVATGNPGKLLEMQRMLDVPGLEVVGPADLGIQLDVDETGASYAENAALKARAWSEAAGCLALADDSGLEVDALDGRPGIYSARFGTPDLDDVGRYEHLLAALRDVPPALRTARYRAVVAIVGPDVPLQLFDGTIEGRIASAPRGSGGFGYDPIFEIGDGRTAAELDAAAKNAISHRGQAVRSARAWLAAFLAGE